MSWIPISNKRLARELSFSSFEFKEGDRQKVIDLSDYTTRQIITIIAEDNKYKSLESIFLIHKSQTLLEIAELIFEYEFNQ